MAIERISELDWASWESQLMQKCSEYKYANEQHSFTDLATQYSGPWKCRKSEDSGGTETGGDASVTYGIQQQIIYNADALNGERTVLGGDRSRTDDIIFWNDLVKDSSGGEPHKGYRDDNTTDGRQKQKNDQEYRQHNSMVDPRTSRVAAGEEDETEIDLSRWPKNHVAKSLIEVSEYLGEGNNKAKFSNYISRKVSLLWFFNVVKAIVDVKRLFRWLTIGCETKAITCEHPEAESDPDTLNETVTHASHSFLRSTKPEQDGSLKVYGNAQFNGEVSTFHSEVRFHDEVRMWDELRVFGQSHFSKDINGTAMRVRWGDLAEYYRADKSYEPGTLVKFGGMQEITVADSTANAVVTSSPGLVLNEEMRLKTDAPKNPVGIALVGRVPVKVWGGCCKFDLLVPDPEHPGWARVQAFPSEQPIARALENKMSEHLVLCATNFKI